MNGSTSQAAFYYQNNIAALKIIESLFFDSDIIHIELENYDKGNHIDDIIVYRKDSIEYYQVKWAEDEEKSYTLYNLLTAPPQKKSIFRQLADGYNSIKNKAVDFSIILFTSKKISSQARPSEDLNHSLKNVINDVIIPLKGMSDNYEKLTKFNEYQNTLETIRKECNLSKDDFDDFMKKLIFSFSNEQTEQIQNSIKSKLDRLGIEERRFEKLLDCVVKWSSTGESITKDTVLRELGISDRFEDKLSHFFKVSEKHYVPNNNFIEQLNRAINTLDRGYIFIEGLPGIGKSTALTKYKEINPGITFAYYCFIPDQNDFGELRHKAQYFLKSMCVAIEQNFSNIDLPHRYSDKYEEKLNRYIDTLGTLNQKIIFIIDGLDHVHRDIGLSSESLLNQIKGVLPKNVFFILSSQYTEVLSTSVINEITTNPLRHIKVTPFVQKEIVDYLNQKGIQVKEEIVNKIEIVSGGIPLYLHYISELLLKTEKKQYSKILKELPSLLDGEINTYHEYLCSKILEDEYAKWILAIFANRKENTAIDTIKEILSFVEIQIDKIKISETIEKISHLLKVNESRSYSIFHNSFREFILSKTPNLKNDFNKAIALYYEYNPYTDEAYRNYFRHLQHLEDYQKIISTTTLEWLKQAWANYRTPEEISDNIAIALNACIEEQDMANFIRIIFLKAQILLSKWNINESDINFPLLFLRANLTQNSIRAIWDGDFLKLNKVAFAHYLSEYHLTTGNILPQNIIEQGFSKISVHGKFDAITTVAQAKSLVSEDINSVFNQVDKIKWTASGEQNHNYHKKIHTERKNKALNQKIKLGIVDYLYVHKQFNKLKNIVDNYTSEKKICIHAQIALIKLLLPNDKKSTLKLIEKLDSEIVENVKYLDLISFCCDFLDDKEMKKYFPLGEISIPVLSEEIINKEGMKIKNEIINLPKQLKYIWIFNPSIINQLHLKISVLPILARNIYNSIMTLSELWYKERNEQLSDVFRIEKLQYCIKELYTEREKDLMFTNHSLFSGGNNDGYFIARDIHRIFEYIFRYAIQHLSQNSIDGIINYWLNVEKEKYAFNNHKIALLFADIVNEKTQLSSLTMKLIQYAEKIARYQEETMTLVGYLADIAECYGKCKFPEEFNRIYKEIFDVSFGLGYKKDYQSSNIIKPLEELHKIEPNNTLIRLAEIFNIQNQLADVGRSRMHHICTSELIEFTIKYYPELGFSLFTSEEKYIAREETLKIVLSPLIEIADKEELPLYLSVIKTIPLNGSSIDNHLVALLTLLFERALQLYDTLFFNEVLDLVKYTVEVELGDHKQFNDFSGILEKYDKNPVLFGLPAFIKEDKPNLYNKRPSQDEKFLIRYEPCSVNALINLIENDYPKFQETVSFGFDVCLKNRILSTARNEYYRSKSIFEKFYNSLPSKNKKNVKEHSLSRKVTKYYIEMVLSLMKLPSNGSIKISEFNLFFDDFVEKVDKLFSNNEFCSFVDNKFEYEEWVDNFLEFINEHKDYIFSEVIAEKDILKIIDETSILSIDSVIQFIEEWTQDRIKAISLLKVAHRLIEIDKNKAISILEEFINDDFHYYYSDDFPSAKLDFDLFEMLLKVNSEYGKKFLLKNYLKRYSNYSYDLISKIDQLTKYKQYFKDESNIVKTYYDANLQYNKELTKGLAHKERDYNFIASHKEKFSLEECVIKYLISLFDYPVVYIKHLALRALFELLYTKEHLIKYLFEFGIKSGSDNQIEYTLILLHTLALKIPYVLYDYKKELLDITKIEHFNIQESLRDIFHILLKSKNDFLSHNEVILLDSLNRPSLILTNSPIIKSLKGQHFLYSKYQSDIVYKLYTNEEASTFFQDNLYADLVSKQFENYNEEKEGAIHRRYNINTNFDNIEITTPYYDQVKSSINRIFHSKIKQECFDYEFIEEAKLLFRLYDPSELIYKSTKKPVHINWLPQISKSDFISFKDGKTLCDEFVNREDEYITLFESGSQRNKERHGKETPTCYFHTYSFLTKENTDISILKNGTKELMPFFERENIYNNEFPATTINPNTFPLHTIKPLLEISVNKFRGEETLHKAIPFLTIMKELEIESRCLLDILLKDDDYPIKASFWKEEYTFGRRRFKPIAEGFTLKIKRDIFIEYLKKSKMTLCYDFTLKRSIDGYHIPENYMKWQDFNTRILCDVENLMK
jgi:hypothetical protein